MLSLIGQTTCQLIPFLFQVVRPTTLHFINHRGRLFDDTDYKPLSPHLWLFEPTTRYCFVPSDWPIAISGYRHVYRCLVLQRDAGSASTVQPRGDGDATGRRHHGGRPHVLVQHDPRGGGQVSAVCLGVAATYTSAGWRYALCVCVFIFF